MSAQERLTAALDDANFSECWVDEAQTDGSVIGTFDRARLASKALASDPTLAQDIEDGEALRLLEAAAAGYALRLGKTPDGKWWFYAYEHKSLVEDAIDFGSLRHAADACRAALESRL